MAELAERIESELEEVRRMRDELRLQVHLGKAEAQELWESLEHRFSEAEGKAKVMAQRAEEPLADIGEAARLLLWEIRSGYHRLREIL